MAARIEGSGPGLALVEAIAEARGGEFDARSGEGEGNSITVAIPAEESPPPSL